MLLVPRFGGYLVAAWLLGIIVNLVSIGGYYDVALRDFGLLLAALTLARLAKALPRRVPHPTQLSPEPVPSTPATWLVTAPAGPG